MYVIKPSKEAHCVLERTEKDGPSEGFVCGARQSERDNMMSYWRSLYANGLKSYDPLDSLPSFSNNTESDRRHGE